MANSIIGTVILGFVMGLTVLIAYLICKLLHG